ncbi:hypothetical protein ACNKHU_17755 [Shigella flexneri]
MPTQSVWRLQKNAGGAGDRPGHDIVDDYTYAFMGDGCMMEGISPRGLLSGGYAEAG